MTTNIAEDTQKTLSQISLRLVKGRDLVAKSYNLNVGGNTTIEASENYIQLMQRYLDMGAAYYLLGGTGCTLAVGGADACSPKWLPTPYCWSCAGGQGEPPISEGFIETNFPNWPTVSGGANAVGDVVAATQPVPIAETRPEDEFVKPNEHGVTLHYTGYITVRMSSIGDCRRKVASKILNATVTNQKPHKWDVAAKLGQAGEKIVVNELLENNLTLEHVLDEQIKVALSYPEVVFVGHPDGDVLQLDGKSYDNLEIKCPGDSAATSLMSSLAQDTLKATHPQYWSQSQAYMAAKGQDATLFVVMNRNSGEMRAFFVEAVTGWAESTRKHWAEVAPTILAGELPAPDYSGTEFMCIVCEFKASCPAFQATHKK